MQFRNKQFEAAAADSMRTLDKLKEKLNFKGASKGLDELTRASDRVSLSGLTRSADAVEVKFSAMSIAAIASIERIVNKAADAGARIVKDLTVKPVSDGFKEYELKMGSVQTIMASTGESLQTVTGYLDELNTYADKTIYSFADMTQNIGKFTNAGVGLRDSVKAIQGISNVAAVSGANANEASRAMYNFAQALSAGSVKLIDWKSIELANMATVEFKNELLDTAVSIGTVTKASDGMYRTLKGNTFNATKNFNDTLQDQWLTTDVLISTLGRYADANTEIGKKAFAAAQDVKTFTQLLDTLKEAAGSGWATTWELVIGNFEEAKTLWTAASNTIGGMIDSMSDERNAMLRDWRALGGRDAMMASFGNAWRSLLAVITPVRDAMREVFPKTTGEKLANMTKGLERLTASLKVSEETAYTLKVALKVLLLPLHALVQVVKVGASAFGFLTVSVWRLIDSLLAIPSKIGSVSGALKKVFGGSRYTRVVAAATKIVNRLNNAFLTLRDRIASSVSNISLNGFAKLKMVFESLSRVLEPIGGRILDRIVSGLEKIADFNFSAVVSVWKSGVKAIQAQIQKFSRFISPVTNAVRSLWGSFDVSVNPRPFEVISKAIKKLNDAIANFSIANVTDVAFEMLKTGFHDLGEAGKKLLEVFEYVANKLDPVKIMIFAFGVSLTVLALSVSRAAGSAAGALDSVSGTLNGFTGVLKAIQTKIMPSKMQQLLSIIAALAGSLVVLSLVNPEGLASATKAVLAMMGGLATTVGVLSLIQRFVVKTDAFNNGLEKLSKGMLMMAGAVTALSVAVSVMGRLRIGELGKGLAGAAIVMAELTAISVVMGKHAPTLSRNAVFLLAFAASITLVMNSISKLAGTDFKGISSALVGMTIIMGLLATMSVAASKVSFGSAAGIGAMAIGLLIFVKALKVLAKVDVRRIADSIAPMLPLLVLIRAISLAVRSATGSSAKLGTAVLGMSAGILILVQAVKQLANVDPGDCAKATIIVSALFGVFALVGKSMTAFPSDQKPAKLGKEIFIMSGAILLLGAAIKNIGKLDLGSVVKGTASVSALLGMFALIGKIGSGAKASIGYIISITAAVGILSSALMLFSLVPTKELLSATAALSVVLASFGLSVKMLGNMKLAKPLQTALVMGTLIGALSGALVLLSTFAPDKLLTVAESLGLVVAAVGVSVKMLSKTDWSVGISEVKALGLMLGGAVLALGVLQFFDATDMLEKATAMSEVMGAAAISARILGGIKGGAGLGGIKAFVGVIGTVTAIVGALGVLGSSETVQNVANNGARLFAKIGEAIGSFIGNIIGGIAGGAKNGYLQSSAEGLVELTDKVAPFIEYVQRVDDSAVTGAKNLSKIMLAMGKVGVVGGLTGWLSSDIGETAKRLKDFTPAVKAFVSELSSIGADNLNSAAAATESVSTLFDAMPKTGGFLDSVFGSKNPDDFASGIKALGDGLASYMSSVSGVSFEQGALDGSVNAARALSNLAKELPSEGGMLQEWFGHKSFDIFSKTDENGNSPLSKFATAMVAYGSIIEGGNINSKLVEKSTNLAQALASLVNSLPSTGGKYQEWFGEKDLSGFSSNLKGLADALAAYGSSISASNFDPLAFADTIAAANLAVDLLRRLPKTNGIGSVFSGERSLTVLATDIKNLGYAMESFSDNVSSLDIAAITASADFITGLVDGIAGKTEAVKNAAKDIADAFADTINSKKESYKDCGKNVVDGIVGGITRNTYKLNAAVNKACESAIRAANSVFEIHSPSKVFYQIGEYVVEGLRNGISDNEKMAATSMLKMGSNLLQSIQTLLGIHSPSRVMRDEVGRYIVMGIAEGIASDMSAEQAAEKKVSNIVGAFKSAVERIDIRMSTVDLEQKLFEGLHTPEGQQPDPVRQMESIRKKLELESEKVAYANAEYKATAREFGESSKAAQEAYNRFLQEQINLSELANELFNLQKSTVIDQQSALTQYRDIYKEMMGLREMLGWTEQQAQEYAATEAGLDPKTLRVKTKSEFESALDIFQSYMRDVDVVVDHSVTASVRKASTGGRKAGTSIATGMAAGFSSNAGTVLSAASETVDSIAEKVSHTDFSKSVSGVVDGLVEGIKGKVTDAGNAGASLFDKLKERFNSEAGIHSPSVEMYKSGTFLVMGLANGIRDNAQLAADAMARVFANGKVHENEDGIPSFMEKVVESLRSKQAQLISVISDMLDSLFGTSMTEKAESYYQNGYTLGESIANGVRDGFVTAFDRISEEVDGMLNKLSAEIANRLSTVDAGLPGVSVVMSGYEPATRPYNAPVPTVFGYDLNPVTSTRMARGVDQKVTAASSEKNVTSNVQNVYNFTQNNTSPKPLSRGEIYRQTKNQFSAFKEATDKK